MMDRRRFLETLTGVALSWGAASAAGRCTRAGLGAGGSAGPGAGSRAAPLDGHVPPLDRVGLQLYTVRELMAADVAWTLERVAAIGYGEVEFAGYFDHSPAELRRMLDDVGLAAPAAHVGLPVVVDDLERTIDAARVLGHRYLVVPWLPEERRRTLDGYRRTAELFNRSGERCREAGIRFGYHNHAFEFERTDGRVPLDVLIAETEPELVTFEMDLYWVVTGGGAPLDYIERFPGRFELSHVKDRTAAGEMTDVGSGVIDFPAIFAHAERAGFRHHFVEHDNPPDPIATIRTSYEHLRGLEA